jgi:uncharacterized protein (DUF934 family)
MPNLIKQRRIATDNWRLLESGPDRQPPEIPAEGDVIVPFALWQARRGDLLGRRHQLGVWLESGDRVETLAADLGQFALVAVNFEKFADGRGFSTARLLRERYGYAGEVRAIGQFLPDQLPLLERCGFDAFVLRDGQDAEEALRTFDDFSEAYQASVRQPAPLFRRRAARGTAS